MRGGKERIEGRVIVRLPLKLIVSIAVGSRRLKSQWSSRI
jgi:hypothetical protein